MNIYKLQEKLDRRGERRIIPSKVSALKKAAGGEDIVTLSDEAMERFRIESYAKDREDELIKLALQHIDDFSPELGTPCNDPEFAQAEKLTLLAELVIRVAIPGNKRISYERVADFVIEQLNGEDNLNL